MIKTGFVYDAKFLDHDTGYGHPECPQRLSRTMELLQQQGWYNSLIQYQSKLANREVIQLVHHDDYITHAKQTCQSGQAYLDSMDVAVCKQSYDIARLATGSLLTLADQIVDKNVHTGFAMVRPPGHHAEASQALGFCLFNNVAVLARYLQNQHGFQKILILDWDVHHGNGTQHLFEEDPSVLYISTHQYPYYPGTGAVSEDGIGKGKGATLNCPMSAGYGDKEYELAFIEKILPKIDEFKPEFIIISAGFDAHSQDPLADMNLSTEFYGWMTERIMEKADQYCEGRIISALEGGYNLDMLARCVTTHLAVLSNNQNWNHYP